MNTIKDLTKNGGKVYIYLADETTKNSFMKQAEAEGFTFGDCVKPTERHTSDIVAVNNDMTISYVTSIGRMAFGSNSNGITRIDYKKYISEDDDYLYHK